MNFSQPETWIFACLLALIAWIGKQMVFKMDSIAQKLGVVDKDLSNINIKLDNFNNRVNALEKKIEDQYNSIMNIKDKIHDMELENIKNKEV